GTLRLDAATFGSSVWTAGQGLTLGVASGTFSNGGILEITGTSAQTFGAVTVNAKANTIRLTGNMALSLGAVTRGAVGGTINFDVGSSGVTSIASTTTALSGLVSGGAIWTDASGVDWAAASGSAITKYSAYTALGGTSSAPTISNTVAANYLISNATTGNITMAATGTIGINTLKFSDTNSRTIDVRNSTTQGILRLGSGSTTTGVTEAGGILIAPGSGALTIGVAGTPGTISAGSATTNSTGDLIFINQSSNALTINSIIAKNGNGSPGLVNSGTGKVILAGANTWAGVIYLNSGTLEVAAVNLGTVAGPLGMSTKAVGNILLNGGSFRANLAADGTTDHGFTINAPSTIEVVANTLTLTTTLNGVATANQQREILNAGILKKTGAGTLELKDLTTNANNANLSIEVIAGTLLLNKVSTSVISAIDLIGGAGLIIDGIASGAAPTVKLSGTGGNQISDASSVVVNSGTVSGVFDLNGLSETIDGLAGGGSVTNTLGSTTSTLSLGGNNSAGLSAYTLAASAAGVNSTGLNSFSGALSDGAGTLALTKVGSGTQILSGTTNTYAGLTTISAGTLQMGADNVLPSGAGKLAVTIIGNNMGSIGVVSTSNGSDRLFAPGTLDLGGFNLTLNGLNSTTGGFVTSNPTLAYNGSAWAVAAGRQSAKNLTLGAGDASASFNGVIRDGYTVAPGVTSTAYVGIINLIKTGTGTQTLSGANTFSGSTSVQAGILALAGADNRLSSSATVTLGSGSDSGFLQLGNSSAAISQQIAGLAISGSGANNAVVGG
ncbi:MAG: autotransporter-associated beta strand repeat-containing protein, partial [bacterium]